ncbi:MAG: protein kinase [Anaeromyxobacter sp.]|nr:protein kinase [Anaeromyxobacter sp.]
MTAPTRDEPASSISALLSELAESPDRSPEALLPELRPGDVVAGRFELRRELGRGGFGLVFEALDRDLGRLVAFKAIRPVRTRALEMLAAPLKAEAEAAARLNHPNVVTLHDSGVHEGTPYLIMELLRGETLAARLRRGPLPPAEALRVALEVARGLDAAHAAGVLHRDLKPGNVFLTEVGAVKLVDFGLASIMGRASLAAGTPAYMAPEQQRGEPEDARADVFGAAAVLHESLTGALPYPVAGGRSAAAEPGPPPPLPLADPPPELVALLLGALSRDPAGRPQDAAAWLAGLERVERAYAVRAQAEGRAVRRRRLRRLLWAAGAASLVVAGLVASAQVRARAAAELALRQSRLLAAADAAADPLLAALLLAELPDDPPPRAVEVAQRVLHLAIPSAALEGARGGFALALSPDGALAAAGMRDGTTTVFRTDGRGAPLVLRHPGTRVNDLAFTPDGARLVAAGHEGALHLHRLAATPDAGAPAATPSSLPLGQVPLVRLRLSPDGGRAAVASQDGRVRLVDLAALSVIATAVHDAPVLDLAFSPDGRSLYTADGEGVVRRFDGRTAAALERLATATPALALVVAPGGQRLAVAGEDGQIRLLGPRLVPLATLGAAGAPVTGLAWSPDGARLASAAADGTLTVQATSGAGEPARRRAHRAPFALAWSAAGERLLTFSSDGRALLWRADGEAAPVALEGPSLAGAAFTPDGARVVGRSREGTLRVWPVAAPGGPDVLIGHHGHLDTVEWSRDGTRLLTSGHDGTARLWDRATGRELLVITDPAGMIHSAGLDPGERLVLTASEDGVARVWRCDDGALVRELPPAGAPLLFAAWSPDGGRIATAALDGVVRVHGPGGGAPLRLTGHEAGVTHVAFSPDGRTVASASQFDATVRLWPAAGGPARTLRADRAVYRAGLSPAGDVLAVAEVDGPLRLFRTADLTELPPLQAWPERLWAPAWSADGARLALASADGSVRVVSADGRGEPVVLRGHQGLVSHLAFRPDGRELASASSDGTARITAVDWPLLRERLAAATGACLTTAQRMHLLDEAEAEARRRHDACERRHGREPPATPAAPAGTGGSRASLEPERDRRGT